MPHARLLGVALIGAAVLAAPGAARAQRLSGPVDSRRSSLVYTGHHPTHDWRGTSRQVSGTVAVDPAALASASVAVRVPVESFDSGNDNRDDRMIDVVRGDDHPVLVFTSTSVASQNWARTADGGWAGLWQVTGQMQFAGRTVAMTLPVTVTLRGGALVATAQFPVSLAAFGIRPPNLLGLAVRDRLDLVATVHATVR